MYVLKVKKFECVYLRLASVEENIEGDANFHRPPEAAPRNGVNGMSWNGNLAASTETYFPHNVS